MLLQSLPTIQDLGQQLTTGIMFLLVIAIDRIVGWLKNKKAHKVMSTSVETLLAQIRDIKAETTTNGGGSMKDMVIATNKKVELTTQTLNDLKRSFRKQEAQQKARLELQLNENHEMTFLCNKDGECTFVNKALQLGFGMNKESLLDFGWLRAIENQKEKEEVSRSWKYSVSNEISYSMDYTVTNQINRTKIEVTVFADPIWDDDGNLMWYFGKIKIKSK